MKRILTLYFLISICCITKLSAQWVAVQDSLALVDLYDSTNGPNWYNNSGWKTTSPVAVWDGVGVSNNRVVSLKFTGNKMTGKIPASFKNLSKLTTLFLLDNGLHATLQEFLDSLTALVTFHVGEYYFTDSLPPAVANLTNLQEFTLYGSYNLKHLPAAMKNLSNLVQMDVGYNALTGDISNAIPPTLPYLNIAPNNLNFDPIEKLAERYKNKPNTQFVYGQQANIAAQAAADSIWVNAGGTPANNTYTWYKVGQGMVEIIHGNAVYHPSRPGSYYAEVSNAIATDLILTSDPVKAQGANAAICPGTLSTSFTSDILGSSYQWQKSTDSINYAPVLNSTDYSGVNSSTLNFNNVQAETVGTRYRCLVDGSPGAYITITFKNKWIANTSGNWENNANWSCGTLPAEKTDVVIESGTEEINSNVTVRSLRVMPGASLTVNTGYTLTVTGK